MKQTRSFRLLRVFAAVAFLAVQARAWEPNAGELDAAMKAGDLGGYFTNLTAWLNQKVPADLSGQSVKGLLADAAFVNALDQRQLILKSGVVGISAFAKADPANQRFLTWLMGSTKAMDMYIEGATPTKLSDREANGFMLPPGSLEIWKKIFVSDPDSKEGLYLRLAIATAISPPGTGNRGAGMTQTPGDPLDRYMHFKKAHKNNELFPSFDKHDVWELRQITSSCASDADLAWGREMINTWRPDLREKEQVINSTSAVWRRNSPFPYENYKWVLAGGGKCGPRSSWSVFICQAFGIPVVGVGQPAHACAAYKATYPSVEPQPGNVWKVVQGRGWAVSRLPEGMSGQDFLDGTAQRLRAAEFSQVEHLRWLASALASKERAAAVMEVAHEIQKASAEAAAKEVHSDPADAPAKTQPAEPPFAPRPGVIHVEAENFDKIHTARVIDCYTGGKQVHFNQGQGGSVEYTVDMPAAGTYGLTMQTAAVNVDQVFEVASGTNVLATVKIPMKTHGLWELTDETDVKLGKGSQTLKVTSPAQRGISLRWFELKAK